jgi:hypothetical protein
MLPAISPASAAVAAVAIAEAQNIQPTSRPMRRRDFNDLTGIVIQIIDAGLPAENNNPYFLCVYDVDGRPWPIPASLMGRQEIIKYVRQRFGDYAASATAAAEALTLH